MKRVSEDEMLRRLNKKNLEQSIKMLIADLRAYKKALELAAKTARFSCWNQNIPADKQEIEDGEIKHWLELAQKELSNNGYAEKDTCPGDNATFSNTGLRERSNC